jgi:magnesium transporter
MKNKFTSPVLSGIKNLRGKLGKSEQDKKIGLHPGALVHVGKKLQEEEKFTLIEYSSDTFKEYEILDLSELKGRFKTGNSYWLNIDGVHNKSTMELLGELFNLHVLVLEDIMNTEHRPKFEDHVEYFHQTLKMITLNRQSIEIESEQISFILKKDLLITFQEKTGDIFQPVRERLKTAKTKIRSRGTDYLYFALTDIVVDNYFIVLDTLNEISEEIEDDIFNDPSEKSLQVIQKNKKDLMQLRKQIYPLREALIKLNNNSSALILKMNKPYFSDLNDHLAMITDMLENLRDINTGLKDMYLSSISLKMNKVMKVLTIIATIFIPLTFIAGIYGMNFDIMPELHWEYGYYMVWGIIVVVTIGLVIFFRKRKWL